MTAPPGRRTLARYWRCVALSLGSAVILAALLLGALRLAIALVPGNADRIVAWIERETGLRFQFAQLDARLRAYGPEVVLRDLRILDREGREPLFATREGAVGLDLWSLFRTGELVAGRVRFSGAGITIVRLEDGRVRLLGLRERAAEQPPFDFERLPAGRVDIRDSTVEYRDLASGRRSWVLRDVGLVAYRARGHVNVTGSARLPVDLGTRLEFEARLEGALDTLSSFDVCLGVDIEQLQLPGLAQFLPPRAARPTAGDGRLAAMVDLRRGRLHQARLEFGFRDVALQLPPRAVPPIEAVEVTAPHREPGAPPLAMPVVDKRLVERPAPARPAQVRYATLAGDVRLKHEGDTWTLRARDLRLGQTGGKIVPASVSGSWRGNPTTTFEMIGSAMQVDLGATWPLVLAAAPASLDRWLGFAPTGEIHALHVEIARERAGAEPRFAISADLARLSTHATGRWPGVSGLSAALSGTDQRGRVSLAVRKGSVEWPRWLRGPVRDVDANGQVDWSRNERAWVFRSPVVELRHPQVRARGAFELTAGPGGDSPRLALDARVEEADVGIVRQVLPIGRLEPRSIAWLDGAFVQGRVTRGEVTYRGPVRRFPFRGGEGEFLAVADVAGTTIDYFPGFAPLSDASGTVTFRNAGLTAQVDSGVVGGLEVTRVEATIADLKEPVIDVDAAAAGDVGAALTLLKQSPLGPTLGSQFMQLAGHGPAGYGLRLHLPTRDPRSRDYRVRVNLREVTFALPALREPVQRVSGEFVLHNLEASANSLEGSFLDGPFVLDVEPGPIGGPVSAAVVLSGHGRISGARLPAYIGLPNAVRMSGTADWNLEGRLERRAAAGNWWTGIDVSSDLRGLEIAAPRPFAKAASDPRPTRVSMAFERDGRSDVQLSSGAARARMEFARGESGRLDLERGIARFDSEPAILPARRGMAIAGEWPEFDLGEWFALGAGSGRGRRLSDWLGPVDVHLDQARVLGFELHDVTAHLQPQPAALQVSLGGPMAEGQVTIPLESDRGVPIRIDMRRLQLQSARRPGGGTTRDTDPRTLSALSVQADDLIWQGRRFGRVRAEIAADPLGLRLASLETSSPDFTLSGSGGWLVEGATAHTRLDLHFASQDLAAASRALGYRDNVEAEAARIDARLNWLGGPSEDALSRMDGTLLLELDNGQLRNVKPGAGRILGLMSVGDLPRRLSLDFSDVTDEGLAFNTVRGDFAIRSGSAYTGNLLLKGAAVDIGVAGRTGLAAQDYDQVIVVSGNPSGPLAVAGGLAAGPVGVAGGLLLSQLFKDQLQGLTRVYYRVTGPWSAPVVERVSSPQGDSVAGVPPGSPEVSN